MKPSDHPPHFSGRRYNLPPPPSNGWGDSPLYWVGFSSQMTQKVTHNQCKSFSRKTHKLIRFFKNETHSFVLLYFANTFDQQQNRPKLIISHINGWHTCLYGLHWEFPMALRKQQKYLIAFYDTYLLFKLLCIFMILL